ncbi:hypothetical protein GCM10028799_73190 [Kribbella italica]
MYTGCGPSSKVRYSTFPPAGTVQGASVRWFFRVTGGFFAAGFRSAAGSWTASGPWAAAVRIGGAATVDGWAEGWAAWARAAPRRTAAASRSLPGGGTGMSGILSQAPGQPGVITARVARIVAGVVTNDA